MEYPETKDATPTELQAESDRIDNAVDLILGGDDADVLVEALQDSDEAHKLLAYLCAIDHDGTAQNMKLGQLTFLANVALKLSASIKAGIKDAVIAGNLP